MNLRKSLDYLMNISFRILDFEKIYYNIHNYDVVILDDNANFYNKRLNNNQILNTLIQENEILKEYLGFLQKTFDYSNLLYDKKEYTINLNIYNLYDIIYFYGLNDKIKTNI